ncbi:MAG: DUF2953 domain-containing protein [Eubacterium sp.]|nr:DUF2953 domain-containing protein [Eubacterium sp.]
MLGIAAVLVLLILFFPVGYKAEIVKNDEECKASGCVYWLFRAVNARFSYDESREDKKVTGDVRLFGFSILPLIQSILDKDKKKKKQEKKAVRKEAARKPSVAPGERSAAAVKKQAADDDIAEPDWFERVSSKISGFFNKIRKLIRKIRRFFRNADKWITYFMSSSFDQAATVILKEGGGIFRHIFPRTVKGYVRFGTNDPSSTGMLLGIFYSLCIPVPEELDIIPDFMEECFETNVSMKGRIFLSVILVHVLKIFKDKEVRVLVNRIRKSLKQRKERKSRGE